MRLVIRIVLSIIGVLMALMGVFWILQGTGIVPVGIMANHIQFAFLGVVWIAIAAALVWLVNRPKRKSAGS